MTVVCICHSIAAPRPLRCPPNERRASGLNEVLQRTFSFPKRHFPSATHLNEVEVANLLYLAAGCVSLNRHTSKGLDLLKGGMLMDLSFENATRTSVPSNWTSQVRRTNHIGPLLLRQSTG